MSESRLVRGREKIYGRQLASPAMGHVPPSISNNLFFSDLFVAWRCTESDINFVQTYLYFLTAAAVVQSRICVQINTNFVPLPFLIRWF